MKRQRITLAELAERSNLLLALWKAARGRARQPAVQRWLANPEPKLDELALAILNGQLPRHQTREFVIHDPKRRTISAPCFADRVLHHAIFNFAEPRFETALVVSSFACRPGRGVHAGVRAVQAALRRWPWFVQVDVASYFASIDHRRLLALLRRRFKGDDFLALLERVVRGQAAGRAAGEGGRGLPIGALTSQHFANAYLDAADRWLLAQPAVRAHVRYMDDMVWWCRSTDEAAQVLAMFGPWLHSTLGLSLKPSAGPSASASGITWCGFEVSPQHVWPGPRKRRRYVAGAHRLLRAEQAAWASEQQLQRAHDALVATLAHTQSVAWRQRIWRRAQRAHIDGLA